MDREEELKVAPMREADPSKWPPGVRTIAMKEVGALGVDANGDLYWHGKQVEIKRPLVLNFWQSALAAGAAGSAIILALLDILRFCAGR